MHSWKYKKLLDYNYISIYTYYNEVNKMSDNEDKNNGFKICI